MALLELTNISKTFGGVRALRGVDVSVESGEIRGLVGENGSGKTTLLRILAGELPPDSGTVVVGGTELAVLDAAARLESGVGVVFQEAHVCPDLTVGENMLLGRLPTEGGRVNWKNIHRESQKILDDAAFPLRSREVVRRIAQDEQHLTEVARVEARQSRILAFDETTASLTADHVGKIFDLIRKRQAKGAAILFISHRLHEVFEICDSVTVLRDGEVTGTLPTSETDEDEIIRLMVGRDIKSQFLREPLPPGEPQLVVRGVTAGRIEEPVDLEVRAGEVLGIGGLVGSGRSTLLEAIHGLIPRHGEVSVGGRTIAPHNPRAAIAGGIGFVPEDRRSQGLAMDKSVRANATMVLTGSHSLLRRISRAEEQSVLATLYETLSLKAPSSKAIVRTLSGGNQQKVVLGRWLAHEPPVLLLDEPTRGIDVGTKREIYELIETLAAQGTAMLLVSSELPELMGLCDRIIVFREGRRVNEFTKGVTEEELVAAMAGASDHPAPPGPEDPETLD